MQFEWDSLKSARNAQERGLPFDVAMAIFDGPTLEVQDRRRDYGEVRVRSIGMVRGIALVCVYVDREGRRRIISLRKANRNETDAYRAAYQSGR
ncbi:MAG: BrnT family toxin [Alphaproteobacteria bacterium]|nr:BrnT family toxin [Alphaproteobacteria bacterium]